ncbi:MAG: hypothetical protein ABWY93_31970, partial [Mycobacterium sp.]
KAGAPSAVRAACGQLFSRLTKDQGAQYLSLRIVGGFGAQRPKVFQCTTIAGGRRPGGTSIDELPPWQLDGTSPGANRRFQS